MKDNEMIDELLIPLLPGIGKRIKKFRNYRGLTIRKMAQLMDTPERTISKVETGKIPIPMLMLLNFCQYLGANLNWLLTGNESMVIENRKSFNPDKLPDQEPNLEI